MTTTALEIVLVLTQIIAFGYIAWVTARMVANISEGNKKWAAWLLVNINFMMYVYMTVRVTPPIEYNLVLTAMPVAGCAAIALFNRLEKKPVELQAKIVCNTAIAVGLLACCVMAAYAMYNVYTGLNTSDMSFVWFMIFCISALVAVGIMSILTKE